ncbi:hypothetical protein CLOLEP_02671 [[Clostridium] leptum DSM 753]|uniref:Uncharacterized protein n=1 Tax=[Clostridium] leptum DSM 753 TaxID=428125 RepID=A7VVQ9_9FIRM|nr:hypothetical protein CLOLEP_02671 [[Clostridium] leptum DSM 753]
MDREAVNQAGRHRLLKGLQNRQHSKRFYEASHNSFSTGH